MKALKVLLALEVLLGVLWTVPLITTSNPGLGALLLFAAVAPLFLVFMACAAIMFFKRPETRILAGVVFALPVAVICLPFWIQSVTGPVLASVDPVAITVLCLVGLPLATCLFLPHQVAQFVPTRVLASRGLHVTLVTLIGLMFVPWIIIAAQVAAAGKPDLANASEGWVIFAIIYAFVCCVVSLFGFLGGYVSLFQRRDRRQQALRVVQAVLSLMLLVPALPVLGVLFIGLAAAGAG